MATLKINEALYGTVDEQVGESWQERITSTWSCWSKATRTTSKVSIIRMVSIVAGIFYSHILLRSRVVNRLDRMLYVYGNGSQVMYGSVLEFYSYTQRPAYRIYLGSRQIEETPDQSSNTSTISFSFSFFLFASRSRLE